ncbi:MAG: TldD/PmbA family protein [Anaerolineae bacterium]|nr:TldD/PmbA family protein [Anaerolineae bacterium]
MRDMLSAALKASRADYTEIRIEEREASRVSFRGPELETASTVLDKGGIVRCLVRGGGWGVATFNDLTDISRRVEQAYEGARAIQGELIDLAEVPVSEDRVTVPLEQDFRGVPLTEKRRLAAGYNDILRTFDPAIIDTSTSYWDSFSRVTYANSEGTLVEEERPMVNVSVSAMARADGNVQRAFEGVSKVSGFGAVLGHEEMVREVAERAVALLKAPRVKGGRYTVVCNPKLAGVFAHEAFGHLSEADFVYANPQAQEMMVLGRRFGQDILNIVDDGSIPGLRGSHKYDDEGVPAGRSDLIKDGVLVGRLHSRETAAKMGERPTGNARATGYRYPPIVRMTNTYVDSGDTSFEDMIADVELGIYACDAFGGQTALENFSFSSAYAYMIREGRIEEMVRDVILAGNLFHTLMSIEAVGNDFEWADFGMCGKGQGGGLPVAIGSPHIRIRDVAIGGD